MAAMEAMMGGIDSMGGRGCGSRITEKGLKMGSKGKRRNAKIQSVKTKAKTSPAASKGPPLSTSKAAGPVRKQVICGQHSCSVLVCNRDFMVS